MLNKVDFTKSIYILHASTKAKMQTRSGKPNDANSHINFDGSAAQRTSDLRFFGIHFDMMLTALQTYVGAAALDRKQGLSALNAKDAKGAKHRHLFLLSRTRLRCSDLLTMDQASQQCYGQVC